MSGSGVELRMLSSELWISTFTTCGSVLWVRTAGISRVWNVEVRGIDSAVGLAQLLRPRVRA